MKTNNKNPGMKFAVFLILCLNIYSAALTQSADLSLELPETLSLACALVIISEDHDLHGNLLIRGHRLLKKSRNSSL